MSELPSAFDRSLQLFDASNDSSVAVAHRASHHTGSVNAPQKTSKRDALLSFRLKLHRSLGNIFREETAKTPASAGVMKYRRA
jgi:hypothetical protein